MTTEVTVLCLAVFLGIIHLVLAAAAATKVRGVQWNLSSRGDVQPPLPGAAGRLNRAFENFKETFPFFLAAVVALQFLGKNSSVSALAAESYLVARALYLPVYALDIKVVRTILWVISCASIVTILCVALLG